MSPKIKLGKLRYRIYEPRYLATVFTHILDKQHTFDEECGQNITGG